MKFSDDIGQLDQPRSELDGKPFKFFGSKGLEPGWSTRKLDLTHLSVDPDRPSKSFIHENSESIIWKKLPPFQSAPHVRYKIAMGGS